MKVLFIKNSKSIGKIGDIKEVSDGYARNFLIKNGIASIATPEQIQHAATLARHKVESAHIQEEKMVQSAEKLKETKLVFEESSNKEGMLYGSIDQEKIVGALEKYKITLQAEQIHLEHPLKKIGEYLIPIRLTGALTANLPIVIKAK
jgi:large subunit ribosomal protein L9